jgi:hypothetical protein
VLVRRFQDEFRRNLLKFGMRIMPLLSDGNAVGIQTGYKLDDRGVGVRFPVK